MKLESIDLIYFAIFDFQKIYRKLLENQGQQLVEILSNLLNGMNKISNENQNLELIMPSLELIDQILSQRDLQKYDEAGSMNKED